MKTRTTAYFEKTMKPVCRLYLDAYCQGNEALGDILELMPPSFYSGDLAFTEGSPVVGPVDQEEFLHIGQRLTEWQDIAKDLSELKTESIYDAIKFVQLVLDSYGDGSDGPIIVISQEVKDV